MEHGDSPILLLSSDCTKSRPCWSPLSPSPVPPQSPPQAWHWLLKGLARLSPGQTLSPDKGEPASSLLQRGILAKSSYLFLTLTISSILYFWKTLCSYKSYKGISKERHVEEKQMWRRGGSDRLGLGTAAASAEYHWKWSRSVVSDSLWPHGL